MGSRRASVIVSEDEKLLFIEDPPEYLDLQFNGYKMPPEPEPLNKHVDWLLVKDIYTTETIYSMSKTSTLPHPLDKACFTGRTFKALDPSLLAILDISNTARCSIYCRA